MVAQKKDAKASVGATNAAQAAAEAKKAVSRHGPQVLHLLPA